MISLFLNVVLPIFAVIFVGYVVGRRGIFDNGEAQVVNKLVFYILLPPLLFTLVARAPFERFDLQYVLGYLGAEVIVYASVFCLARYLFKREFSESLLLGMATAFCNHTFIVLPIVDVLHGPGSTLPVISVIVVDNILMLGGTTIILDMLDKRADVNPLRNLLYCFVKNPNIMALLLGAIANVAGLPMDGGIGVYGDFLGSAAAPCSLFALGVGLSQKSVGGDYSLLGIITAMKLVAVPILAWVLFVPVFNLPENWADIGILTAAAPSGVLAYVIGCQYKTRVDLLSQVILVTTFLSAFTISVVAGL